MVPWTCPSCDRLFPLPEAWLGCVVECPLCRFKFAALRDTPVASASPLMLTDARPALSRRAILIGLVVPVAAVLAVVVFLLVGRAITGSTPADERIVREYILEHAPEPKRVQFIKWGRHLTRELAAAMRAKEGFPLRLVDDGRIFEAVIRVQFRAPDQDGQMQVYDRLYMLTGSKVIHLEDNKWGDRWDDAVELAERKLR